ncbi:hypothetical protein [Rhizobium sp. Leaf306]|uniref:hypothetical protein n=1 Tax=Rhizobium sp. Leaf306 TaxID=1736330 RepID=UPI001FCD136B|nr:hypothetical protein [Rhizobium sp. Leaf306]
MPCHQTFRDLLADCLLLRFDRFDLATEMFRLHQCPLLSAFDGRLDVAVDPVEIVGTQQIVRHGGHDPLFQFEAADGLAVRADNSAEMVDRQLLLPVCTAISILRHNGIGPETVSAFEDAAQQILRPVSLVQAVCCRMGKALLDFHLPLFDRGPERIGDNAQLGLSAYDPFILIVRARNPPLAIGVLAVFAPVPDHSADVEFVVQDPGTAADMSANGRVAPFGSAWSRYGRDTAVEFDSNVFWRTALGVFLENPDDDTGFGVGDLAQTWNAVSAFVIGLLYAVSIGNAAGSLTLLDGGPHTFARTVTSLLNGLLTEDRAEVHLDIGYAGVGSCGPNLDIVIAQLFADLRAVGNVTREPVNRQAKHDVNAAAFYTPQHLLDAGPALVARATDGAVVKGVDETPVVLGNGCLTPFKLRLDRLIVLAIGRIACVN